MIAETDTQSLLFSLFERLNAAGLPTEYVRKVALPTWWNDEIASDHGGYERALGLVHRTLGVPIEQLWDPSAQIHCPDTGRVFFKKNRDTSEKDFQWARCISVSAAGLASSAMATTDVQLPPTPGEIRREILAGGYPYVDLSNLLSYLWSHGVPVLHIDEFPGKKMVGLATKLHGRPCIVLSKRHMYPSLMLFDLAHEVGHILNGDLADGDVLIDEDIGPDGNPSDREIQANRSGVALLTGDHDRVYNEWWIRWPNSLAKWAREIGEKHCVSPGVVAQSVGFQKNNHGLANGACKKLEPNVDSVAMIRHLMMQHLQLDELLSDEAQFLIRIAGRGVMDAMPAGH